MKFRTDIQGLRAFAVIAVLIFHINKNLLPGGFIGVDMFFVISGYLISGILINKKNEGTFSFVDFYVSRIKRIIPVYFLCLILTTLITSVIYFPVDVSKFRVGLFWSALFNSNNYFAGLDTYFGATSSENPLLHTWSLAIEMQFYLYLPVIIVLFSSKWAKFIILVLLVLLLGYSTYNIFALNNKDGMYFSLLARSPEFFLGVLLNYFNFGVNQSKKTDNVLSIIGLTLILSSLFLIRESSAFPGLLVLWPCIGTCLLLQSKSSFLNQFLSQRFFQFIGELSYSIYLWHWPILALYRYAEGKYEINNYFHLLVILIVVLFLSWVSYTYVERPFRRKGITKKFVVSMASIIIVLGVSAFSVRKVNERFSNIPLQFISPSAHGLYSHGSTYSKDVINGSVESIDTLLLLGDSHALTMRSYLDTLGKEYDFSFRSVTNDRFPPIPNISLNDIPLRYRSRQKELTSIASEKIKSSKIIVLARAWDIEIPSFEVALETLINNLDSTQHLIIFLDYPSINANPVKINRTIVRDVNSDFEWQITIRDSPKYLKGIAEKYKNVHLLDFSKNEVFSEAPFYNDTVMYYDSGHLNKFGSQKYALATQEKFMSVLNQIR